jgi:drug/metabolite transporter (DMT)-like permease
LRFALTSHERYNREAMNDRALPYAVLLLAQAAIGSAALLARAGLAAGLAPLTLSAWRLGIASAVLVLLPARGTGGRRQTTGEAARLVLAGICLALHFVTWFASLAAIPVARSTLLVTTSPLWSGIFGRVFLGTALGWRFFAGLAIAGAGCAAVTLGGDATVALAGGASPLVGDLLATAGAILMAAYLLLVEDLQHALGTRRVVLWTCTAAALALFSASALAGVLALPASGAAWASILGMALVPQLIGHTALNWSLKHFPAGVVGAATLLEPVFAAALAWVIYAEHLTATQLSGAVVLLAGVALAIGATPQRAGAPGVQPDEPGGPGASNRGT